MTPHATVIATELITTIQALGNEGGLISPSIYDTAQTLRYAPLPETEAAVIAWLADKQQADGGWGDPATPYARTMPTLAALLAIHTRACPGDAADLIERGITFLHAQAPLWHELSDDIPIAAELIIPTLARTALTAELAVPLTAYAQLEALGRRRRQLLTRAPVRPATPLAHSWEAWGTVATAALLDGAGSIGHNPAATAAWIHAASAQAALADHVAWRAAVPA